MNAKVTFSEWVVTLFDHAPPLRNARGFEFFWNDKEWRALWRSISGDDIEYVRTVFERVGDLRRDYTAPQLCAGLWFLIDPCGSGVCTELSDESGGNGSYGKQPPALSLRTACVSAMIYPFANLFNQECGDQIYKDRDSSAPVTEVRSLCFMWWDILFYGLAVRPAGLLPSIVDVLATLCRESSLACVESALHGLGHYYVLAPDDVRHIIHQTLRERSLPSTLHEYALDAARGHVQ